LRLGLMSSLRKILIPASSARAFSVKRGEVIKVIDSFGGQVVDFVCFNAQDTSERIDQSRTRINNWKYRISTGDSIYTNRNNQIFSILEDTVGIHDLTFPGCSSYAYEHLLKNKAKKGCVENLIESLGQVGLSLSDIPPPISFFMEVEYDLKSNVPVIKPAPSKSGDYITLRAEMDCIAAASSCADDITDCNHGKCKPVEIHVASN